MDESEFEKGDRVWSFSNRQWATIIDINPNAIELQVYVRLDSNRYVWCVTGDLVFEEIPIPESARTRAKPKHEFKPGDVVLAEGFEGQPELRVFVRSNVISAVLRVLGTLSYDYEQALSRIQPYDRTLLGFDAVEEIRLGESKIRPVFTVEEGDNG